MIVNGPSDFRDFAEDRSQFTNVIYLANGLLVSLLFLVRPLNVFNRFLGVKVFAFLLCFLIFNVSRSYDPIRSISIVSFFAMNIFACMYICAAMKPVDVLKLLSFACISAVFLSFFLIIFVPSYGRMTYVFPGAWQGIFIHKNVLGKFATLALIVVLCMRDFWSRPVWLLFAGAAALLAVGTGSATSTMATVIIIAAYFATKKRIYLLLAGASAVTVLVFGLLYTSALIEALTDGFDKSATLSGRTTLWDLSLHYIGTKPFLGYGLGAFWRTPDADALRAAAGWVVPHAHNGILELALNIGWFGVISYLLLFCVLVFFAIRCLNTGSESILLFPFFIAMHTVIYAIGEANLLRPNSYTEVMFVVCLSSVFKYVLEKENRIFAPYIASKSN